MSAAPEDDGIGKKIKQEILDLTHGGIYATMDLCRQRFETWKSNFSKRDLKRQQQKAPIVNGGMEAELF